MRYIHTEPHMQILTYQLYNARSLPALQPWSNPASSLLPGHCVIFCSSARTSSRHVTYSFSLRGMGQMGRQTNKIRFTGKEVIKSEPGITWACWSVSFPSPIKSHNILETSSAVTSTQWHIIKGNMTDIEDSEVSSIYMSIFLLLVLFKLYIYC